MARFVTPGSVTTARLSKSISRMRLNLLRPSSTPSASGSAPPDSEVPAPRGTTLMPCSKQYFRICDTCCVVLPDTTQQVSQIRGQAIGLVGQHFRRTVDHALE